MKSWPKYTCSLVPNLVQAVHSNHWLHRSPTSPQNPYPNWAVSCAGPCSLAVFYGCGDRSGEVRGLGASLGGNSKLLADRSPTLNAVCVHPLRGRQAVRRLFPFPPPRGKHPPNRGACAAVWLITAQTTARWSRPLIPHPSGPRDAIVARITHLRFALFPSEIRPSRAPRLEQVERSSFLYPEKHLRTLFGNKACKAFNAAEIVIRSSLITSNSSESSAMNLSPWI